jgi:hypothetical protein
VRELVEMVALAARAALLAALAACLNEDLIDMQQLLMIVLPKELEESIPVVR